MTTIPKQGHFQIVRQRNLLKPRQQWHFRWVSNFRTICSSEKYSDRDAAIDAIHTLPGGTEWLKSYTPIDVDLRRVKL